MPESDHKWLEIGILVIALMSATRLFAAEIAPFRITSLDGRVMFRHYFDQQLSGTSGLPKTGETRQTFEEEVFVHVGAYVYHPNLLKLDIGGGPLLVQSHVDSGGLSNSSNDTLYNFSTHLSFLEQKPYPFSFYYEHLNPSVYTTTTSRFLQENNKVGGNAALRFPDSGINFNLDAFHASSMGSGIDQIVDDQTDQAAFRFSHSMGKDSNGQFLYQWNKQESRSGSVGVPIQPTTSTTNTASYDTQMILGSSRKLHFNNVISYVDQKYQLGSGLPSRRDLRITPDLRWYHNENLDSYYRINYLDSSEATIHTSNRSLITGLNHKSSKSLSESADMRIDDNRTTGLSQSSFSVGGTVRYERELPVGQLQLSYGSRYNRNDRSATVAQVPVFGEQITLSGTTPVELAHSYVVIGTIVVSNLTRTQIYIDGTDYRVITIGSRTEIERLAVGAISDGQTVLVDYDYQTGGTVNYSMLNQNLQATWSLKQYYNIYTRLYSSSAQVHTGSPTLPLNTGTNWSVGARADLPLKNDIRVGGELVIDNYRQTNSPYDRSSIDIYTEIPLPFLSTLRLAGRSVRVNNIGSPEDVDLRGINLRLRSRPWFRANLGIEASFEEDTGSTLSRTTSGQAITLTWRVRRLLFSAEARLNHERQGTFERDRTLVRINLVREIL